MDQNKACARLINAIICLAIMDSCKPPLKVKNTLENSEEKKSLMIHPESLHGINFLFRDTDTAILYFDFLEIDVGHFRKKLLECMDSNNKKFQSVDYEKMLTPAMRRAFRWNFRYWESKYYSKYFKGVAA